MGVHEMCTFTAFLQEIDGSIRKLILQDVKLIHHLIALMNVINVMLYAYAVPCAAVCYVKTCRFVHISCKSHAYPVLISVHVA